MSERDRDSHGYKVGDWLTMPLPPKRLPWWRRLMGQKPDATKPSTMRVMAVSASTLTIDESSQ